MHITRSRLAPIVALLAFSTTTVAAAPTDRQLPPPGGPAKPFRMPARETFALANGLRVSMVPHGQTPKVRIEAVIRTGRIDESAGRVGLAALTALMMREGTVSRNAQQIAKELGTMGGSLEVSAGSDEFAVAAEVFSEFGPPAIALLAEVICRPLLPARELPRVKNDLLRQNTVAKTRSQTAALERFDELLYPDHPYGRTYPSEDMLAKYTSRDVREFHRGNFGAARAHLYIAGKFDDVAMRKAATAAFASWLEGASPRVHVPLRSHPAALELIDRPGAAQSTMMVGTRVADPASADLIPLQLMNALLGEAFFSRITSNVRERKGYSYSPYSILTYHYRDAYWSELADVSTAVTGPALQEILHEIERLRWQAPDAQELTDIKNFLAGSSVLNTFVMVTSSRQGLISQLRFVDLHGLRQDYLDTYIHAIHAVTPQQVRDVANRYLDPSKLTVVIVGDKSKIAEQVAAAMELARGR